MCTESMKSVKISKLYNKDSTGAITTAKNEDFIGLLHKDLYFLAGDREKWAIVDEWIKTCYRRVLMAESFLLGEW